VKPIVAVLVLFAVAGFATAETCTVTTQTMEGREYTHEVCEAVVEELFKQDVEGFRYTAYAVQWRGAHVIVEDPLSKTSHIVGDQLSFLVVRVDIPEKSIRALSFMVFEPPKPQEEECP